jgi:hypothetical protein
MSPSQANSDAERYRSIHSITGDEDLHAGGHAIEILPVPEETLRNRPEWQLACRVAASKTFSRSELLPRFLLYVCAQQLAGNTHEITEQRIGIEVFQRPQGYNPGEDNIVRNYARTLRKRLADYFEAEGAKHSLWIEIPRGGYVPRFQPAGATVEDRSAADETPDRYAGSAPLAATAASRKNPLPASRRTLILLLFAAILLGLLAGIFVRPAMHFLNAERANSAAHSLWTQLFQQNRNLMIVPPDSGLGILENLTGQLVTLDDYASGRYLAANASIPGLASGNQNDLERQRYTSMAGLKIATSLLQLPEFIPNRSEIRNARDMSPEDFKNSNLILIGSVHTNPWVGLFEKSLNFRLMYTGKVDQSYIVNASPVGAEQKIYRNGGESGENRTYGVIDFLPNLHNTGHILIIQGLNMAATQAAAEILFNRRMIGPVLDKAKQPDGSLKPFELLIETSSIVATAPSAHIIATRFNE